VGPPREKAALWSGFNAGRFNSLLSRRRIVAWVPARNWRLFGSMYGHGDSNGRRVRELQPGPQGFLIDAYAQYLGSKGEVLNDSWNLARMSSGPNGLTETDLSLPESGVAGALSNTAARKTRLLHFFALRPSSSSPKVPLRLDGVVPMIVPDSAGVGTDRYSFSISASRPWTFMLKPKETAGPGAFSGKIWVRLPIPNLLMRFNHDGSRDQVRSGE